MNSNNVVVFPKENKNIKKIISIEEINKNVEQMSLFHIQETIASLVPIIFTQLDIAGFSPTDEQIEEDIKDGAFLVEALRSIMCKHYGIYHPFQKLADGVFQDHPDEDGVLKIVDVIAMDLSENKEED
jgi:hypothetical protein